MLFLSALEKTSHIWLIGMMRNIVFDIIVKKFIICQKKSCGEHFLHLSKILYALVSVLVDLLAPVNSFFRSRLWNILLLMQKWVFILTNIYWCIVSALLFYFDAFSCMKKWQAIFTTMYLPFENRAIHCSLLGFKIWENWKVLGKNFQLCCKLVTETRFFFFRTLSDFFPRCPKYFKLFRTRCAENFI